MRGQVESYIFLEWRFRGLIQADKDKAKIITGWLMGEKKVCLRQVKGVKYIYLTKDEQEKYHQVKGMAIKLDQPRA